VVVQHNGSTGPDDLAEEEREINEDLVEPVAAVHERRIGGEALPEELLGSMMTWSGRLASTATSASPIASAERP
jgi:hypothetical protein